MPTEIRINNPHLDKENVTYNNLVKYQVGKISKAKNAKERAEEVRKLWKLVGKNNNSVKDLQFGEKQEDADEFITALLNSIYDERGPLFETSLLIGSKDSKCVGSCSGNNQPIIKLPISNSNNTKALLTSYQEEEPLESNTKKKISLFVQDGTKEVYFQLKRSQTKGSGKGYVKGKIQDDITSDEIELLALDFKSLTITQKSYDQEDKKAGKKHTYHFSQYDEIEESKCKKVKYQPTAFTVHKGKTLESGHYLSYVEEIDPYGKTSWYCYNDDSRTKVGDEAAKEAMKQAYIVKFSVVENGKVDLPSANDNKYWSDNLGSTCWANSSVAIVANSKLGEECEKVILNENEKKLYDEVTQENNQKTNVISKNSNFHQKDKNRIKNQENEIRKKENETRKEENETRKEENETEEKPVETNQNIEKNNKNKIENKESKNNNAKESSNNNLKKTKELSNNNFSIDELLSENLNEQRNQKNNVNKRKPERLDVLQLDDKKTKNDISKKHNSDENLVQKQQEFLKNKSDISLEEEVKKINVKKDAVLEELKNIIKEKELQKITEIQSLKPIIELEKVIEKKLRDKKFVSKESEQNTEDQKFRKYVEEKYKNVELEIFTKHSSKKPSIGTLELVEKEIQKKDEVFPNKLARALAKIANVPNSRNEESAKIEVWKDLTTLDRRVLVDLYNNKNDEKIEFISLYHDVKNGEKADLSINGHNYALDLSKSGEISKIIDCANKLIPKNLVEKPNSEKLLGDRNIAKYQ